MTPDLIKRRDEMAYFHMHKAADCTLSEDSFKAGFDACYTEIYKQGGNEILILGLTVDQIAAFRDYYLKHNGDLPEIFGGPVG